VHMGMLESDGGESDGGESDGGESDGDESDGGETDGFQHPPVRGCSTASRDFGALAGGMSALPCKHF